MESIPHTINQKYNTKMEEEFNLSEKLRNPGDVVYEGQYLWKSDVRDFIKRLIKRGLKRTTYPKYLMLTKEDFLEFAGKDLI